jgi:hypothetical protein
VAAVVDPDTPSVHRQRSDPRKPGDWSGPGEWKIKVWNADRLPRLQHVKPGVGAISREEVFMSPCFDHLAVFQDHDPVSGADC